MSKIFPEMIENLPKVDLGIAPFHRAVISAGNADVTFFGQKDRYAFKGER